VGVGTWKNPLDISKGFVDGLYEAFLSRIMVHGVARARVAFGRGEKVLGLSF
jgi:hypothetical protein